MAKPDEPDGQQAKVSLLSTVIQLIIQAGAIATDTELAAIVTTLQSAIAAKSDAGHTHTAGAITGTLADNQIPSSIARDSEVASAIAALSSVYQPKDTAVGSDPTGIPGAVQIQMLLGISEADYAALESSNPQLANNPAIVWSIS